MRETIAFRSDLCYTDNRKTKNPRKNELSSICRQLKLKARDGKFYNTDVVDEAGLNTVLALVPSKKSEVFSKWMKYSATPNVKYFPSENVKYCRFAPM